MLTNRQNEIIDYLRERKHAKIGEIAKHIYVSETTVRRELTELKRMGLIQRDHGGAVILDNADDISIGVRQIYKFEEKLTIAKMAERHLPEYKTVFIDNSSTALMLAQRLNLKYKTVVTNGITAAMQLGKEEDTTVYLVGGRFNYSTSSLIGGETLREIEQMQFHLMLCSCTSINARGAFESSADQRDVKRAALQNSRYRILLADDTKFNDNSMYRTSRLSDFDEIYTNAENAAISELRKIEGVRILNEFR